MSRPLALLMVLTAACVSFAQPGGTADKLRAEILGDRIVAGPWKNAFKDNKYGAGFRYYFALHGLRPLATDPKAAKAVEGMLDHCLAKADRKTGLWDDVLDLDKAKTRIVDADDSNAAMLILLATDYYATPAGKRWWAKNSRRVKTIATKVLLDNALDNGLVAVYSRGRNFDDPKEYGTLTGAQRETSKALQQSAYLMDSCEVYSALDRLAGVLDSMKDADGKRFAVAADKVAKGVAGLYHAATGAFYVLDTQRGAYPDFYPSEDLKFYPHRMAQVFPQLFDVPLGDEKTTRMRYDAAWKFANAGGDWKPGFPRDGSADGFPAMLRAEVAMKRGDRVGAKALLDWYLGELKSSKDKPRFLMIHELGCALAVQTLLDAKK